MTASISLKVKAIMRATLIYYRNYECAIAMPEWRGWAIKNRALAVVKHDRHLNVAHKKEKWCDFCGVTIGDNHLPVCANK